jgi:signal transduction histidine kinase
MSLSPMPRGRTQDMNETAPAAPATERARPHFGLSGKLLVLTLMFVMIAEVLIYVPSVANFRLNWLKDRLAAAHVAAMVLKAAPKDMVPQALKQEILTEIGAKAVVLKIDNTRHLLAIADTLPAVPHEFDMRTMSAYQAIMDALGTLLSRDNDLMRVIGPAPMGGDFIEIVMPEAPLREAMLKFSVNILLLSIIISAITAALVYLALHYLFVRPMRRIGAAMVAFRANPEGGNRITWTSKRRDEIGIAERGLAATQTEIASMLHQKNHLASLGLAVSKINHDLRNLLASAQLFSDRLSSISDPTVQRFAPKLMAALERAIAFCQSTLSYGQAKEPPPDRRVVSLEALVEDVRENLGLGPDARIRWVDAVERGLRVDADPDQLFRVLLNLARNAVQAFETRAPNDPMRDHIRLVGRREGAVVVIEVADTGPGVPAKARAHLFEAFTGSTRSGGSGLGLAIAAELVRAHGGEIRLVDGTIGATFRITIPDRAVELGARRGERVRA